MAKSAEDYKKDCLMLVNIYIKTVDKQLENSKDSTTTSYLNAYKDACNGMLRDLEKLPTE